jgi:predicted SprT family Zn-dependent metalloprotease/very-short-patch-repair endonuclease
MIYLVEGQTPPEKIYSKSKLKFRCDCGNEFYTLWSSFSRGQAKTCGSCKIFSFKKSGQTQFSNLTLVTSLSEIKRLIDKPLWLCKCGNQKNISITNVLCRKATSCGCTKIEAIREAQKTQNNYVQKLKSEWLSEIPKLIDKNLPDFWTAGTNKKFLFKCDCGNEFLKKFNQYSPGKSKLICGKCSERFVENNAQINNFIYCGESQTLQTNSIKTALFKCVCGRTEFLKIREVFGKIRKTCGKCNDISSEEISSKKFGRLQIKNPETIKRFSEKKIDWICDCGNEIKTNVTSVLSRRTSSCGNCRGKIHDWYVKNQEEIKNLQCPIEPGKILGGIEVLETIKQVSVPFKASCSVCGSIYYPRLHGVKNGESLTCGCVSNIVSLPVKEISSIIQSFNIETQNEYKIKDYKYDIFIPSSNLLIEFNGLKWHSSQESRRRDTVKYKNAISSGFQYLAIFEDEWRDKKEGVINLIRNRLNLQINIKKLRPQKCEIKKISLQESDKFYDKFHYIGHCKSKINYGVFYENELISCISFKKPTRQSSHDYELVRMASNPSFRVHGIWGKLLRLFVQEFNPKSIVSFSDNRLFPGQVYEKIGFKFDGTIAPDYYWVRNRKRFHKSGLRKKPYEQNLGKTETELRTAQGYQKVWDLGKKRWILVVH